MESTELLHTTVTVSLGKEKGGRMMSKSKIQWLPVKLAAVFVLCIAGAACSPHSEEALIWCGPATAQMIIENDTKSSCPNVVLQEDLWADIEGYRIDTAWDTDPRGMEKTLEKYCSWHWSPISHTDEAYFMRRVAYYMHKYSYPAAVVLDTDSHPSYPSHAEHWVDVMGVFTDKDPVTTPSTTPITLEYVLYIDPSPPVFGDDPIIQLVTGTTWFSSLKPVNKPASTAYHGKYVAVIEPPEIKGLVVAKKEPLIGEILPLERAAEIAMRSVEKLMHNDQVIKLLEEHDVSRVMKRYGFPEPSPIESFRQARPLEPLLVNERKGAYFVVPLTFEGSRLRGYAQAAVAVNAYDGSFQELGMFRAMRYLDREQVKEAASRLPQLEREGRIVDIKPVFTKSAQAHRLMPLWQVRTEKQVYHLDTVGRLVPIKTRLVVDPQEVDPQKDVPRKVKQRH
jgi:hypothetical protein